MIIILLKLVLLEICIAFAQNLIIHVDLQIQLYILLICIIYFR